MRSFLWTTLIGGVLFLIPLAFVVAVIGKAFQVLRYVAAPIDRLIPIESLGGFALVEVITAGLLVLGCFVAGALSRAAGRDVAHTRSSRAFCCSSFLRTRGSRG